MNMNVKLPITSKSFYGDDEKPAIKAKLLEIYANYKSIIDTVASLNNIPKELIISVIFIESRGDANAKTKYAVGLMQVSPSSATDIITRERSRGVLTQTEKNALKNMLGSTKYDKVMTAKMGDTIVTESDLFRPNVNILLGSMMLTQIIDDESKKSGGKLRLDKAIVRYNKGYYAQLPNVGTDQLLSKVPNESRDYILKLAGKDGTLDILV